MDENPYASPQFRQPAEKRALLPLWRRIVSIPLLIFGVGYLLDVPAVAVTISLDGHWIRATACSMAFLVVGAGLTWSGWRLRHPKTCTR